MSLLAKYNERPFLTVRKDQVDRELTRSWAPTWIWKRLKRGNKAMSRKDGRSRRSLSAACLELAEEVVRSARGESFVETSWQDLRFSTRMLRKSPWGGGGVGGGGRGGCWWGGVFFFVFFLIGFCLFLLCFLVCGFLGVGLFSGWFGVVVWFGKELCGVGSGGGGFVCGGFGLSVGWFC